jgi:hypothetical protein
MYTYTYISTVQDTQQSQQSPKDHLQDNTGILRTPRDNNVSTIAPLHPTCNPIKWDITHVNIPEFITSYALRKEPDQRDQCTSVITNSYIHSF